MRKRRKLDSPEIPIAPMIDCVFLMLVYFMTTSSLEKSEADLECPVGQAGIVSDPLESVDEQELVINGKGRVHWNGSEFNILQDEGSLAALGQRMEAFRLTCEDAGSEASLRLAPVGEAPHQAMIFVLDAASLAGIETVHFP